MLSISVLSVLHITLQFWHSWREFIGLEKSVSRMFEYNGWFENFGMCALVQKAYAEVNEFNHLTNKSFINFLFN